MSTYSHARLVILHHIFCHTRTGYLLSQKVITHAHFLLALGGLSHCIIPQSSDHLATMAVAAVDGASRRREYIFQESDFDSSAQFRPPAFISKYRRISSLESLREQLHAYNSALKDDLYNIINKDYKEFITIATKLDGVDTRLEHLKKPLVDLKCSVNMTSETLLLLKKTLMLKLQQKKNIQLKKELIESSLQCMQQVQIAATIIEGDRTVSTDDIKREHVNATGEAISSRRSKLKHLLANLSSSGESTKYLDGINIRVFAASEMESAAVALRSAHNYLKLISLSASNNNSSPSSSSGIGNSISSLLAVESTDMYNLLQSELTQKAEQLTQQLLLTLKNELIFMFKNTQSNSNEGAFSKSRFSHYTRSLMTLGRPEVLEEAFVVAVVTPMATSALTQGKVDGTGGRNSFSNLQELLKELVLSLRNDYADIFHCAEEITLASDANASKKLDLVINGTWAPISRILVEKFPTIFTTGIANTLSRCYNALEETILLLSSLAGEQYAKNISTRIIANSSISAFEKRWKLDLYFSLRTNEISKKIDKFCSVTFTNGLLSSNFNETNADGGEINSDILSDVELVELKSKLSLNEKYYQFHMPIFRNILVEMIIVLSKKVCLKSLIGKFYNYSISILKRLEIHIALICDLNIIGTIQQNSVNNPSILQNLKQSYALEVATMMKKPSPSPSMVTPTSATSVTPSKTSGSNNLSSPNPSSSNLTTTESTTAVVNIAPAIASVITVDELMLLLEDLKLTTKWLTDPFQTYAIEFISSKICNLSDNNDNAKKSEMAQSIKTSITSQCNVIKEMRSAIYEKIKSIISNDCKTALSGVKAIAGKYRMTNKPPPDNASQYVSQILAPLKTVISKSDSVLLTFKSRSSSSGNASNDFTNDIIVDLSNNYLLQVQNLLETVKQMDSTLSKRSRLTQPSKSAAAGASMSDSEKIYLQLQLDIKAFGVELKASPVCYNIDNCTIFKSLSEEVINQTVI